MTSAEDHQSCLCKSCGSKMSTSPLVISRGSSIAQVMLIGEAPGAMEEKMTIPFVGRSGKLLNMLLELAGFDYDKDVYITNLVKTRPPKNRTPTSREISLHLPWLYQQIKVVKPLIIVLIGSSALKALLGIKSKITQARGTWHNWNGIHVMPIFHPSYLLRNPSKVSGKPYDLTCLDFLEVRKKLKELTILQKDSNLSFPISN